MAVPYTFGNQSGPIPLNELDANFAYVATAPGGFTLLTGAAGNGVTDDTLAIQAFLDKVSATQVIGIVPAGIFAYTHLIIRSNTVLLGTGPTTCVFKALREPTSGESFSTIINDELNPGVGATGNYNYNFEGIGFDGNNFGNTGNTIISLVQIDGLRIHNCYIYNWRFIGLACSASHNINVTGSLFYDIGDPTMSIPNGGDALWFGNYGVSRHQSVKIIGNWFLSNRWSACQLSYIDGLIFENNYLSSNGESTLFITYLSEYSISNNVIVNSIYKNISGSGIEIGSSINGVISNNIITNPDNDGISLTDCQTTIVEGNQISSPGANVYFTRAHGIGVYTFDTTDPVSGDPFHTLNLTIRNNAITTFNSNTWAAISFETPSTSATVERCVIEDNNFYGTWQNTLNIPITINGLKWGTTSRVKNNQGDLSNSIYTTSFQTPAATGNQTITNLPFRPNSAKIICVVPSGGTLATTSDADINEDLTGVCISSATDGTNSTGSITNNKAIHLINGAGTLQIEATITAFGMDAFGQGTVTLNYTTTAIQAYCKIVLYP